jgi:hypothetical protein
MECCKRLTDGTVEAMPFARTIATDYYDGPTEGFTECSQCGQTYSFRKLDWDDTQDLRIVSFAPIVVKLGQIATRLGVNLERPVVRPVALPLPESVERFIQELLTQRPTRVAAIEGWPGQSSRWRNVAEIDVNTVSDWFSFLGVRKNKA